MKNFNSKRTLLQYIVKKLSRGSKVVLLRGSTARGRIRYFSDFDVEAYGDKLKKPYYEIVFLDKKPVLLSAYFYKYYAGKRVLQPKNVKLLVGAYSDGLKPDFSKDSYSTEERVRRECQLVVDFLFKYLRHGARKDLEAVQKRIMP